MINFFYQRNILFLFSLMIAICIVSLFIAEIIIFTNAMITGRLDSIELINKESNLQNQILIIIGSFGIVLVRRKVVFKRREDSEEDILTKEEKTYNQFCDYEGSVLIIFGAIGALVSLIFHVHSYLSAIEIVNISDIAIIEFVTFTLIKLSILFVLFKFTFFHLRLRKH